MEAVIRHLVEPIVDHPDAISIRKIDGDAVVVYELQVHPDDRAAVEGDKGKTLRSIRNVLSAAAGREKATVDLVDEHGSSSEE